MEGIRYVDMFSTKGIEYVLVIVFLLAFVLVWRFLRAPATVEAVGGAGTRRGPREWFRLNETLYYHPGHTWAQPQGDHIVRVGIDDFAQKLVGTPGAIELPAIGTRLAQGGRGWRLEVRSRPIDMLSPVGGTVTAVNEEVLRSPQVIDEDPYGKGWLLQLRVPQQNTHLKNLLSGRMARAWMNETVHALRARMSGDLGVVLQDGGLPVRGFAVHLSPDRWDEVAAEFLRTA